jgi:hypothetical protein
MKPIKGATRKYLTENYYNKGWGKQNSLRAMFDEFEKRYSSPNTKYQIQNTLIADPIVAHQ